MTSDPPLTDWPALHGDAFRGRKAFVTGGAGFIGSHLCEALFRLGASVVVLDDLTGGNVANLRHLTGVHFIRGSILDTDLLARCIQGSELVFHQAALGSVPASVDRPRRFFDVNVAGTLNVLEAAKLAGAKRVMFAASSSAYGDSEVLPKVETMTPMPKSPYAATKVAGEAMMRAWAGSYGIDTVSLRYFNIFGPRQNANSAYAAVIAAFAKALLSGNNPQIYGDGSQSRDFTYVDNAVHANLLAARALQPLNGETMNIACGVRVTVAELAATMAGMLDRPDLVAVHHPDRAGDVKHSLADLSLARRLLGYSPTVSFEAGLKATAAWYKRDVG
ncbi:NAD-dependent epimerase/dehydratase family protein [Humisphaera borealis]|uniref:NAD-dependent epimerase/dehydratase family protein n=1 Tax=Humisphaera borealis TaxID=2807512 RepID=A0A7M2X172_9BACT|nr:NAD-dependent epimerase/dehydratase family protein [Humisphaera borealis]QOV91414.1 NAD-dependent epimerase/dehydratase family protein [Humisphaera borealis]